MELNETFVLAPVVYHLELPGQVEMEHAAAGERVDAVLVQQPVRFGAFSGGEPLDREHSEYL